MNDIHDAEWRLFKAYLNALEERWKNLIPGDRWFLLRQVKNMCVVNSGDFDFLNARRIRKKARLTQGELAQHLGITVMSISKYETQGINGNRGKGVQKYLEWLKDNGYK